MAMMGEGRRQRGAAERAAPSVGFLPSLPLLPGTLPLTESGAASRLKGQLLYFQYFIMSLNE